MMIHVTGRSSTGARNSGPSRHMHLGGGHPVRSFPSPGFHSHSAWVEAAGQEVLLMEQAACSIEKTCPSPLQAAYPSVEQGCPAIMTQRFSELWAPGTCGPLGTCLLYLRDNPTLGRKFFSTAVMQCCQTDILAHCKASLINEEAPLNILKRTEHKVFFTEFLTLWNL